MIQLDSSKITTFKDSINNAQTIVIVPHNNPDGDAMGSALALYQVLKAMGKSTTVISPNEFPDFLKWMPGVEEVVNYDKNQELASELLNTASVIVFVDFNALSRIDGMEKQLLNHPVPRIMIDHHPYPDPQTAQLQFSVPEASSTCELLFQVLNAAGFDQFITKTAAECIYAGIMTDTGGLNYNSNGPETYHTVAQLLAKGINKENIHHQLFQNNSFSKMKLLGYALSEKMELLPEQNACFIALSKDDLKKFNYKPGDTESFVNQALWIEGVDVSALISEKDNMVKLSFRSRGSFPVNKFSATYFNGGGHHNAAGGRSKLSLEATIELFKTALIEYRDTLISQ